MTYDFKNLEQKIADVETWLRGEYNGVRTGRATPALLDSIQVDSYGAKMPINQVAAIGAEDARTLRITPYDMSTVKEIEKAITNANLGVSISDNEQGVRVSFPELTSERREQLQKLIKEKLEHARVSLRGVRDETWGDIQQKEKNGEIGKDDKFRFKDEMEKIIADANKNFDEISERKEKEIMS